MSARFAKKYLKDDLLDSKTDANDEIEQEKVPLLNEEEEEEEEEEETPHAVEQKTPNTPSKQPSKNKKKKKKKKKNQSNNQLNASNSDNNLNYSNNNVNNVEKNNNNIIINKKKNKKEEEIDQLLQQFSVNIKNTSEDLFQIDTYHLLPDNELKRLFGSKTLRTSENTEKRVKGRRNNSNIQKKRFKSNCKFAKAKENWPNNSTHYYTMQLIPSPENSDPSLKYFEFKPTRQWEIVQQMFIQCVESGDPQTLINLLYSHPYHVGNLLQVSDLLKQTGEYQQAAELVERALFSLEYCWSADFNWAADFPLNRIPFSSDSNKDLYRGLFRQLQMLGRRGCCRTGLELCKFILSIDRSDPLFVIGTIDYFAIRSKQYRYLLDFFTTYKEKSVLLPNLFYSSALASFHLSFEEKGTNAEKESDELLQKALINFPLILSPLLTKCNKSLHYPDKPSQKINFEIEPFFSAPYSPPSLTKLATLFIDKNYSLWTDQKIQDWMARNVLIVIDRVKSGDKYVFDSEDEIRKVYVHDSNKFSNVNSSEYNDEVVQIPRELLEANPANYQPEEPVRRAHTNNPLSLFLSTLLPWNQVPNAPYEEGMNENRGEEGILNQLQQIFGLPNRNNNNNNNNNNDENILYADYDSDEESDDDDDL